MKIIRLSVKNFKKIAAVEINPEGNVITISGKNGAGKSSVLDAIFTTLRGAAGAVERPIRDGAQKGHVEIDLDKYVVRKSFSAKGVKIEVRRDDGTPINKPQSVLDSLFTAVSFDPADFLSMKPKEQREILLRMLDLKPDWKKVDFVVDEKIPPLDALDNARAAAFAERTDINRECKRMEGALDTARVALPADAEKVTCISAAELTAEYGAATEEHNKNKFAADELSRLGSTIKTLKDKIERLKKELAETTTELIGREEAVKKIRVLPEASLPDLSAIKQRMNDAESINKIADSVARIKSMQKEYSATLAKSDMLTERIESIDHFKAHLLATSAMPVDGLGIDAECITFNSIPFSQASHAERLRISILIGMTSNPTLRVMRISDGEKFDAESWRIIQSIAAERDYQLWIEKMENEQTGNSIFIVDGSIPGAVDEIDSELDTNGGENEQNKQ